MTTSLLLTGCSTGIGYHCAHALHKAGYQVVASCRHPDDVARLQQEGLQCVRIDMDDEASIEQGLADALVFTGGRLDVLFNNAAYGQPGALEDLPTAALRQQFESNFLAGTTSPKR